MYSIIISKFDNFLLIQIDFKNILIYLFKIKLVIILLAR